jgi:5-methylcytosine-specific restriction enzyme subunit McrC
MKTITLTERRAVVRRLPRTDLDDLLGRYRGVIEVTPTFTRGLYRVVARGYAGTFRTPNVRWEILPKLPWSAIRWMASGSGGLSGADSSPDWGATLANLLADRLAGLIRERTAVGLHFDYVEQRSEGPTVRGRIDIPRQLREGVPAGTRFHLLSDEFTSDVPWNRIPKAAAHRLLAVPGLAGDVRQRLVSSLSPFDGVSGTEPTDADFSQLRFDARTEPYRPLIRFAQMVLGQSSPPGGESLLVNLEQLFQIHVGEALSRAGALPAGWGVEPQSPLLLSSDSSRLEPLTLRPDLVVRDAVGPRSVWDAKWKTLTAAGPHPDDVHQALGYAAALGVKMAGLIYPGRKSFAAVYRPSGSDVALHVLRLRLVGTAAECERAAGRLARRVCPPA